MSIADAHISIADVYSIYHPGWRERAGQVYVQNLFSSWQYFQAFFFCFFAGDYDACLLRFPSQ